MCSLSAVAMLQVPLLADTAGNIILSLLVLGIGEDVGGVAFLDQVPKVEERRTLANARRLLHRVRDDDDRVILAQLVDQLLDDRGRDRIERRARLVHQDHLRTYRDGARDAQALLLAARQARAG